MRKNTKNKKNKVPRLTEEEYNQYVNSIKAAGQGYDEKDTMQKNEK